MFIEDSIPFQWGAKGLDSKNIAVVKGPKILVHKIKLDWLDFPTSFANHRAYLQVT